MLTQSAPAILFLRNFIETNANYLFFIQSFQKTVHLGRKIIGHNLKTMVNNFLNKTGKKVYDSSF